MNTTMVRRLTVLGLMALPLIALAVVVMVLSWGHSTSQPTEASGTDAEMELSVGSGAVLQDNEGCFLAKNTPTPNVESTPTPTQTPFATPKSGADVVCAEPNFTLLISVTQAPAVGYTAFGTFVDYDGLTYNKNASSAAEIIWPDSGGLALRGQTGATWVNHGDATGLSAPLPVSNYTGVVVALSMTCEVGGSYNVNLLPLGHTDAGTDGSGVVDETTKQIALSDDLKIRCVAEKLAANPSFKKQDVDTEIIEILGASECTLTAQAIKVNVEDADPQCSGSDTADDERSNIFLTRQEEEGKIPPVNCQLGNDVDVFLEKLDIPIEEVADPKDDELLQQLGAFEFEVHYDEDKICVDLVPGPAMIGLGVETQCLDTDDFPAGNQNPGVARLGCFTIQKLTWPDTTTDSGRTLAYIVVRPQPDVYSQAKPNQDNGVLVQLLNVGCKMSDLQGHAIKVFECADAEITIRYLEADVDPNCIVDTMDTQIIAFAWGAEKGSLIYREFINLEPSGGNYDDDIDINDLQFVYGRFGSTCVAPYPDQDPVSKT